MLMLPHQGPKEKMIIPVKFNTMLYGGSAFYSSDNGLRYHYKNPQMVLARLIGQKYGKVIDVPQTLIR